MFDHPKKTASTIDLFADIATNLPFLESEGISVPPPTPKSDRVLPLQLGEQIPSPRPHAERIRTAEELEDALQCQRKWAKTYLRDLTPKLPTRRSSIIFKNCDWRVASEQDIADLTIALRGEGDWESVSIPHYGPPLGKAVTLYRTSFDLTDELAAKEVVALCFKAVDYICKPYLNGVCLGTHEGIFEAFEFDITKIVKPAGNVLLIQVENDFTMMGDPISGGQADGDKVYAATGLGYDDPELGWHHCPAGMGIWQPFRIEGRSSMIVSDVFVDPADTLDEVRLQTTIRSFRNQHAEVAKLLVSIYGQNFESTVCEDQLFEPTTHSVAGFGDLDQALESNVPLLMGPGLNTVECTLPIPNPKIWSPDAPHLYQVQLKLIDAEGNILDCVQQQFGMRTFEQDEHSEPKGKFSLNGKQIRLRGANTMGNLDMCVFRGDSEQLIDDILLARLTNMNFLRLTQHPVQKEIYELCDRLGMMLQTDLPLFGSVRKNQIYECVRQAGAMERLVRPHACNILVSFINEPFPNGRGRPHRFLSRQEMATFLVMAADAVRFENPKRVIKAVDGDYDPPAPYGLPDNHCYCGWYIGHGIDLGKVHAGHWMPVKDGWHFGCGEFGAEGLDSYPVMRANYPEEWGLGEVDEHWDPGVIPQAQSKNFHYLWYSTPETVAEWIDASQKHQEWSNRIMVEAFRLMDGMNTFAIHLFIDAWPAGWMKAIMDVGRTPKKSWFSYRHALAPLAVFLRSVRTAGFAGETLPVEVWVANDFDQAQEDFSLHYEITCDGAVLSGGVSDARLEACKPTAQGIIELTLPEFAQRSTVEVAISLVDAAGRALHDALLQLEVFPVVDIRIESPTKIFVVAGEDQAEVSVITDFIESFEGQFEQVEQLSDADSILVTDTKALERQRGDLEAAVRAGASALILRLAPGEYTFGDSPVLVRKAGMGPRHFVSCQTEHPLAEGFNENDFKFWFDETKGHVSPILETTLEAAGWETVLLSGDGGWKRPWGAVPAVIEREAGEGRWRVCQIDLLWRVRTNPAAKHFALGLLNAGNPQCAQKHPIPSSTNKCKKLEAFNCS
jgi:hypothetical protein